MVIIGAGQAGFAMSRCLSEFGIDHVVIERGKLAERWRSQSWDSLRLLTPNWMTRLPGFHTRETTRRFHVRAGADRPVRTLRQFVVGTGADRHDSAKCRAFGEWLPVSPPTAACGRLLPWWWRPGHVICRPFLLPAVGCRRRSLQMVAPDYRRPEQLPEGGVLVVGASSTGVQLADNSAIGAAGHLGCRSSHALATATSRTRHPLVGGSAWRADAREPNAPFRISSVRGAPALPPIGGFFFFFFWPANQLQRGLLAGTLDILQGVGSLGQHAKLIQPPEDVAPSMTPWQRV